MATQIDAVRVTKLPPGPIRPVLRFQPHQFSAGITRAHSSASETARFIGSLYESGRPYWGLPYRYKDKAAGLRDGDRPDMDAIKYRLIQAEKIRIPNDVKAARIRRKAWALNCLPKNLALVPDGPLEALLWFYWVGLDTCKIADFMNETQSKIALLVSEAKNCLTALEMYNPS